MVKKCAQRATMSVGEVEIAAVNFGPNLDSDDALSGAPTVAEQTTSDLTIANEALNANTYVERWTGETVAVNNAVTFSVSGGSAANSPYSIKVTVDTSAGRTLERLVELSFE